jgi:hypothetical protein
MKQLDAAITHDLVVVRRAEAAADKAARQMGAHPNDGSSIRTFEFAKQSFDRAQAELDRHVKLAFAARLPKFDRSSFDRQLDAIDREMATRHGSDREVWHAIKNAKIEVEEGLPDAQHAAVIMERILNNAPPEEQLSALNSVYRNSTFKSEIRNDPGYQKIIDAKAQDCFVDQDKKERNNDDVLANVRAGIESAHTNGDIKQDFLSSVLRYADSQGIVLPDPEIQALRSMVLGGPL